MPRSLRGATPSPPTLHGIMKQTRQVFAGALFVPVAVVLVLDAFAGPKPQEVRVAIWNLEWSFDHDTIDDSSAVARSRRASWESVR